jgi:OOP family OmpA-OmpF porin
MDGFEDWDGCPDDDQDKDGVADDVDQCPVCPEDGDRNDDEDGCPDLDNDADGLLDSIDRCPDDAEALNGIDDLDGCPDEGGALLVTLEGDRLTFARQPTFDAKGLNRGGQIISDQAGITIMMHPEIARWTLAVAAATDVEAQRQADAIRARLAERGVDPARVDVLVSAGAEEVSKNAVAAFFGSSERSESASDGLCTGAAGVAGKPIDKRCRGFFRHLLRTRAKRGSEGTRSAAAAS